MMAYRFKLQYSPFHTQKQTIDCLNYANRRRHTPDSEMASEACVSDTRRSSPLLSAIPVAIPALQAVPGSRQAEVNGWSHQLLFSYRNPCHKMLQMLSASGQMH